LRQRSRLITAPKVSVSGCEFLGLKLPRISDWLAGEGFEPSTSGL
jgi:hypothetical protein